MGGAAFIGLFYIGYMLFILTVVVFVLVMMWQIRTNTKHTAEKMDQILNAIHDLKNNNTNT